MYSKDPNVPDGQLESDRREESDDEKAQHGSGHTTPGAQGETVTPADITTEDVESPTSGPTQGGAIATP